MASRRPLDQHLWRLRGFLGEEWRWARAHEADPPSLDHWIEASVPGSIHDDLWRAGDIADPYIARNSLLCEWVPERTWVYATRFREPPRAGQECRLRFEGIDFEADIFLNGELLGHHLGMFSAAEYEVAGLLRAEPANALAVVIAPAPREEPQVGRTERVRTAKSRMGYGWDFCPRLVNLGIWDGVSMEWSGPHRIVDVSVRTTIERDSGAADLEVSVELAAGGGEALAVEASLSVDGSEVAVATVGLPADSIPGEVRTALLQLGLERPRLWWPNGSGEAVLHDLAVRLLDRAGRELDHHNQPLGIRSATLVPNEGAAPDARPYTLEINGRRSYLRGWNWVPLDALYGPRRTAKLQHLLGLARAANVNLLRVWGGGLIERTDFYEACDRLGIMVWQEFPLSSSGFADWPSDEPAYLAHLAAEAQAAVRRRRRHPSLVLWCGGNELADIRGKPLDESAPAIGLLREVVERLDPGRAWLPTSPSGPEFAYDLATIARDPDGLHDVHGPWEHQGLEEQYTLANRGTSLLHSEFGAEGMASPEVIAATVPEAERWPAGRETPVYAHRGAWWNNEPFVQRAFGGSLDDVPSLARASRLLQAEALGYSVAADRRRAWRNSGSIPWQFDEPYPMAWSTSAVDYYGRPKPAYHAVAQAYRPVTISASFARQAWAGFRAFAADVWLSNLGAERVEGSAEWRILLADGAEALRGRASARALDPDTTAAVASVSWPLAGAPGVFFLDLRLLEATGTVLAEARYLFSSTSDLAPVRSLPRVSLTATSRAAADDRWELTVRNAGRQAAVALALTDGRPLAAAGFVRVETHGSHLMPGEKRRVAIFWTDVAREDRRLTLDAWNADPVSLREP